MPSVSEILKFVLAADGLLLFQRRKNWDAAVADLKALLKIDPDNGGRTLSSGPIPVYAKAVQDGYNEFMAAKKADKNLPDPVRCGRANVRPAEDETAKAQQAFDRAMQRTRPSHRR